MAETAHECTSIHGQPLLRRASPSTHSRSPSLSDELPVGVILASIKVMDSRIRQLEEDNRRLKKRQRKSEKEAQDLRAFIDSQLVPFIQRNQTVTLKAPVFSGMAPTSMPSDLYIHFPFLREYDMTNRRFVAQDLRCLLHFGFPFPIELTSLLQESV